LSHVTRAYSWLKISVRTHVCLSTQVKTALSDHVTSFCVASHLNIKLEQETGQWELTAVSCCCVF
jgi:hypothetical protein